MIFDKECFVLLIDPFIWVRAESVHVSIAIRDSSLREEEHNILNTNRVQGNEVPWHVGVSHVSLWVSLSRVDNIRELNRILDKKEWCIVADEIDDSLFGVKLDSESSWVTIGVWKTFFSQCCRESYTNWCLFSLSIQEFSLSIFWNIMS